MSLCQVLVLLFLTPVTQADWLMLLHADAGGNLGGKWDAKVEIETKFRNNMSEHCDFEAMPWVAYRFTGWFKLGLGWRELYSRKNTTIYNKQSVGSPASPAYQEVSDYFWQVEHRPLADFILTLKSGSWTVENRLRCEYRKLEHQDAYFRYRNRLRLAPSCKWTKANIRPWVAWEAYYENTSNLSSNDRLNRHRLFVGLSAKPTPAISPGCYYYWERALTSGEWVSNNEIGLGMSLVY